MKKEIKMFYPANLNNAAYDLYKSCLNALGAYEALKSIGADEYLPGYERCLSDLKNAIEKANQKQSNNPIHGTDKIGP